MTCTYILKRPDFANLGEMVDWEIKHRQARYELPIVLPEAAWCALPDALDEISHAIRQAQSILNHAHTYLYESAATEPGIVAMLEMAERGFKHVSGQEGELINDVATVMRVAVSKMLADKVSKDGKGKAA